MCSTRTDKDRSTMGPRREGAPSPFPNQPTSAMTLGKYPKYVLVLVLVVCWHWYWHCMGNGSGVGIVVGAGISTGICVGVGIDIGVGIVSISQHLAISGAIWWHPAASGSSCEHLAASGLTAPGIICGIWDHLARSRSGSMWEHLAASGSIWQHLAATGSIWQHLGSTIWHHPAAPRTIRVPPQGAPSPGANK